MSLTGVPAAPAKPGTVIGAGLPARLAFLAAIALFALAEEAGSPWLEATACGLVGLLIASALFAVVGANCRVKVRMPLELQVGVPFDVQFTVENSSAWRCRPIVVRRSVVAARTLVPDAEAYVESLGPKERVVVRTSVTPVARGEGTAVRLSIEQLGAFGFFWARKTVTTERRVCVGPPAAAPIELGILGGGENRPIGPGLEVRGVREWRPGDGVRHVHWRSTARTGRLAVVETGEPTGASLGVLVVGASGEPSFEAMVATATATVGHAIARGVDCYAWVEQTGIGCVGKLTPSSFVAPFARVERAGPSSARGIDHLIEHIGRGGTLLLVAPLGMPPTWRVHVNAAAAASGVGVVDLLEFVS